ncbi:unnamed protein product, partial [Prorocentrum cordatum]
AWPADSVRNRMAGRPLYPSTLGNCRVVLVEVAADLDEMCKTLGLPDYRGNHGCLRCFSHKETFADLGAPLRKRKHQWLLDTARTSLSFHRVNDEDVEELRDNTCIKRKKGGVVVTSLMRDTFPLLKRGDRVEPVLPGQPDFRHGEACRDYAPRDRRMMVYRRPANSLLFINRLFHVPGIQPGIPGLTIDHFLFDSMHFADLGILHYYMGAVMWRLIDLGFFGEYSPNDHDEVDNAMNEAMKKWYIRFQVPSADRQLGLSSQMCGSRDDPLLKLKAGKSRKLLPFIVHLLRDQGGQELLDDDAPAEADGSKLLAVGAGLMEYYDILHGQPRRMDELAVVHLEHVVKSTMTAWIASGRKVVMKFHIFARHIASQARWAGNPGYSHNYRDETENFGTRKRSTNINRAKFAENAAVKWYMQYLLMRK